MNLVLLHGIIEVTNLKIISETENDLKSCRGQFVVCIQFLTCNIKKKMNNDQKRTLSIPLSFNCFLLAKERGKSIGEGRKVGQRETYMKKEGNIGRKV